MRILLTSKAGAGHVGPLLPFARALRAAGADILFAAPREAAPLVTRAGLPYHPLPDPPAELRDPIFATVDDLPWEEGAVRVVGGIFAGIDTAGALPGTLRAVRDFSPDLVLRDQTEYAGLLVAQMHGIPDGRIAIMGHDMETWCRPVVAPVLDGHRARLGLRRDPHGERLVASPWLTMFPEALEAPDDRGPADALRFREGGTAPAAERSLLYVTYGSVAPRRPEFTRLFRATVEALADVGRPVLFTVGDADRDALGPVPEHVRVERWVPQAEVMPHAAAVLCHGGSGTTSMALAAGVPVVVVPGFADQPRNARRVHELGAGIGLAPWPDGLAGIRGAVHRVLDDPAYARVAAQVAIETARLPRVATVAEALEAWIAPARAA